MKIILLGECPDHLAEVKSVLRGVDGWEVAAVAAPSAARSLLDRHEPAVVLVDVRRDEPAMGWWLLRRRRPGLVVIGSSGRSARWAFDVGAGGYVEAPIRPEALQKALIRAMREAAWREAEFAVRAPAALTIAYKGVLKVLPLETIERIKSDRDYVNIHCLDRVYALRATLESLEPILEGRGFVRIHRSHIVRLDRIRRIRREVRRLRVIMESEADLPVGAAWRPAFTKAAGLPRDRARIRAPVQSRIV